MQPHAKAADEILRQKQRGAQTAGTLASLAGVGLKASAAKNIYGGIKAFLNPLIPSSLAAKGLSKINPLLGDFFKEAEKKGFEQGEVLDHIRKYAPEEKKAKSLFQEIVGDIEIETLDPNMKNQLYFLESIAGELEKKGKSINDPEFQKLAKKVKAVLAGKSGVMMEEATRDMGQQQQQPPQNMQPMQGMQGQPQQGQTGQGQGMNAYNDLLAAIKESKGMAL